MMTPDLKGPERLVHDLHMLTGFTLAYGDAQRSESVSIGLRSEVNESDGRFAIRQQPITEHTVYDLASLTKLFTCVAVFILLENREVAMTDCIGRMDARFRRLQDVSLHDVLCYRAVLKSPERIDAQPNADMAEKQVFDIFASSAPQAKIYSDMNALALKYLIEAVSKKRYIDFLKDYIFMPLSMSETWGTVPEERLTDCMNYNYEHCIINGQHRVSLKVPEGTAHDPKARILSRGDGNVSGHAGLFSTKGDMVRFAQGLLSGKIIPHETLGAIGINRTGHLKPDGEYRQYMGFLCFSKSAVPRLSEVPLWMGKRAFALSGYTGNHIAIDPDMGVFDLLLGNRCHNRLSTVLPDQSVCRLPLKKDGSGAVVWPDGRKVYSSYKYVYLKDQLIHGPVYQRMKALGWIDGRGEKA